MAAGPARTAGESAGRPEYRVEALAKGLRVLSLFSEQRHTWRVTDIAAAVSIPVPTVYRIVMTLTAEGYLEQLADGYYRPAARVLTLGHAALSSMDLVELATPRLQELARTTGETVNLAVLVGDRVLYLVRLRNSDLVTANIQVGSTLAAAHTSIGKLLLAALDPAQLADRIPPESFPAGNGPNARRTPEDLHAELADIRERGWALQDEELAFGLRSVAAGVRDSTGAVVAGVNIAVIARDWPVERIVAELRPLVLATCAEISTLLGHRPTP